MKREEIKQIAIEVIKDFMARQQKKVAPTTAPDLKDKARELLKKCDQKYQKNVLDKLVDND